MLLLVVGRLLEDGRNLLVAILASLGGEIGVLVACLALTCESLLQVLLSLGSF